MTRCFACGRNIGHRGEGLVVDTRYGQTAPVGPECYEKSIAAGDEGYQPTKGGPRLYPLAAHSSASGNAEGACEPGHLDHHAALAKLVKVDREFHAAMAAYNECASVRSWHSPEHANELAGYRKKARERLAVARAACASVLVEVGAGF